MRDISESTRHCDEARASASKCSSVSKNFVCAVIDMVNFNLTFNEFIPREKARAKYSPELVAKARENLAHNHRILVHFLKSYEPQRFSAMFPNHSVECCLKISSLIKKRRFIFEKLLNMGVCTSHECPHTDPKCPPLWVQQALILQYIHPVINQRIHDGALSLAIGDNGNWNDFVSIIRVKTLLEYGDEYATDPDRTCIRIAVWKGRDVAPYADPNM